MKVYNTLTRKKEALKTIKKNEVGIYSCGPTVYWNQHIGHMYAYVQWDTLVRLLRYLGNKVTWVMNITDVGHMTSDEDVGEDKMEKGAKREGLSVWEVAKKYEEQFLESLRLLNISIPDVLCRATEHIKEQIDLAKKIEARGFTYKTKTGLVYDTSKFPEYANFANLKLTEMEAGARVEVDEEKKKPWDFLLWVTNQPNHVMKWPSPWGEGFPGWHLECTAMSTQYLGDKFDIHTGGKEHIGVHHTNEIAQGYGAFGSQTANYWLHNGWLTFEGAKMSKSLGNVVLATDLKEKGFDPLALRYLILSSNYKQGLDFNFRNLAVAATALSKLKAAVGVSGEGKVIESVREEFLEKMEDDLSTPKAIAIIWKMVKGEYKKEDVKATLLELDKILGLKLTEKKEVKVPEAVTKMVEERNKAKKEKNWAVADRLREEIKKKGYLVEDTKDDCKIKKIMLS
jgi:cysteinyl-tRNA synthetase